MAKRRKGKPKRPSIASKFGISQKQYTKLRDESAKARRRLKDFSKRSDAGAYFVPESSDYLLENLLSRVAAGEKVSSIVKEVKNLTAKKIQSGTPVGVQTMNGYTLSARDNRKVTQAIKKANENIRQARKDFDFAVDILPEEFDAKKFVENIGSKESLEAHLKGLSLFTPENLVPTAVNDYGEAGTKAEYEYLRQILERENERRAKVRELTDPAKVQGYIVQQQDYDKRNIDIDKIEGMENLRKRAETWDDAQRVYRSNLYLKNYMESMETLRAILVTHGMYNQTIKDRFDFISDTIKKLFGKEDAVTFIVNRIPALSIQSNYPDAALAEATFSEIYEAWADVDDMFG